MIKGYSPVDYDPPWPNTFILYPRRPTRVRYKPPTSYPASSGWGLDDDAFGTGGFRIMASARMGSAARGGERVESGERER